MDAAPTDSANKTPRVVKGLSEFLAKVLDQLSLSSWLPSAALVIGGSYLLALRNELDSPSCTSHSCGWVNTLGDAGSRLAQMSAGGAVVIVAVVVVVNMLTQAFTFEAIRFLEGYWGANTIMRGIARHGSGRHREKRNHLEGELAILRQRARDQAFAAIRAQNSAAKDQGKQPLLSPGQMEALLASIENRESTAQLSEDEYQAAIDFDWKAYRDPQLALEEAVLEARNAAYPSTGWVMPTRLGNILRRHEQEMGVDHVEPYVQDHFDTLPVSLQSAHDEERTRLDLYATLVFLLPVVGVAAAVVLLPHWWWVLAAEGLMTGLTVLAYRAAIASARAYGSVLVSIAGAIKKATSEGDQAARVDAPSGGPSTTATPT